MGPYKPPRMQEEARRSNYITWGVALVSLSAAWAVEYFGGPDWAAIGVLFLGGAGVVLLLRGHFPHWFQLDSWTHDRIAVAWIPIGVIGTGIALYAAVRYIPPLPFALKYPSVPMISALLEPYRDNEAHDKAARFHETAVKPADAKPLRLWDLFLADFNTILKMHSDLPLIVNGIKVQVTVQAYFDFTAKAEFVGFFIPSSVMDAYGTCVYLSGLDHSSALKHTGVKTSGGVVGQMTDQDDLVFTGRVYLYHEPDLSIEQRAALLQMYRAKHLDVQFRGYEYLLMQDRARGVEKKIK